MPNPANDAGLRTRERSTSSIPDTMRAAAIDRFGGPDVLKLHTVPVPRPGRDEVLVAVHTAGIGPWDAEIRQGWIEGHARFPLILGTDGSGTVVMAGSRVRRLRAGDRVYSYSWANPKGGFYAKYAAVPHERVARFPATLSMTEAGAVATTGLTALQGIDDALVLKAREVVTIHGAAGGVGSVAVQFAKLRRARVLATATTTEGLDFVLRLGADSTTKGRPEELAEAIVSFAPEGVDAVLALAGGEALERIIDQVKRGGRVAYPNGIDPVPRKRTGVKVVAYDAVSGVEEFARLNRAIEESRLVVEIAASYALEKAAKAHERLAQGHVLSKIVLRIGDAT
jgi:NADPH:quinone reductase-like Zn-dependent oxidoreductase